MGFGGTGRCGKLVALPLLTRAVGVDSFRAGGRRWWLRIWGSGGGLDPSRGTWGRCDSPCWRASRMVGSCGGGVRGGWSVILGGAWRVLGGAR